LILSHNKPPSFSTTRSKLHGFSSKSSGHGWRGSKRVMLAHEIVNAEMEHDCQFVHFQALAVADAV
jgi:hypothetical protein